MYQPISCIEKVFSEAGIHFKKYENKEVDHQIIEAPMVVPGIPVLTIRFIAVSGHHELGMRVYSLVYQVPKAKQKKMLEAVNELNLKYRFLRFYMDDDGDVSVAYDFPDRLDDASIGKAAFEILVRTLKVMSMAYPALMEALIASDSESSEDANELEHNDAVQQGVFNQDHENNVPDIEEETAATEKTPNPEETELLESNMRELERIRDLLLKHAQSIEKATEEDSIDTAET